MIYDNARCLRPEVVWFPGSSGFKYQIRHAGRARRPQNEKTLLAAHARSQLTPDKRPCSHYTKTSPSCIASKTLAVFYSASLLILTSVGSSFVSACSTRADDIEEPVSSRAELRFTS